MVDETPSIRSFWFSDSTLHNAKPGQFAMVWVPGIDEVPMSVLAIHGRSEAGVVIKKGGPVSTALWEKKVGDKFWVRGPYGHPFSVGHHHKLLVVGGGTGLVPLISFLVHLRGRDVTLITGARTSSELLFKDWLLNESKDHHFKLVFATDDGTYGEKNQVPKVVEHVLKEGSFDAIYTCGPEPMMKLVYDLDRKSTRLNSSHGYISYAVFCLKKKKQSQSAITEKYIHAAQFLFPGAAAHGEKRLFSPTADLPAPTSPAPRAGQPPARQLPHDR